MNAPAHLLGCFVRVLDTERRPTTLVGFAYRLQHTRTGRLITVRHEHGDASYSPDQLAPDPRDETH